VQFNICRMTKTERCNELIRPGYKVVYLAFKHGNAGKDEMPFARVLYGSRAVKIENVHNGAKIKQPGGALGPSRP